MTRTQRLMVSDGTYVELVQSLLTSLVPSTIMTALFILASAICAHDSSAPAIEGFALAGSAVGLLRLGVLLVLRRIARQPSFHVAEARAVEQAYATVSLSF
ncbi:MAG TPA: hypothetical protein VIL42_05910 [Sphingomicrobium sp.]